MDNLPIGNLVNAPAAGLNASDAGASTPVTDSTFVSVLAHELKASAGVHGSARTPLEAEASALPPEARGDEATGIAILLAPPFAAIDAAQPATRPADEVEGVTEETAAEDRGDPARAITALLAPPFAAADAVTGAANVSARAEQRLPASAAKARAGGPWEGTVRADAAEAPSRPPFELAPDRKNEAFPAADFAGRGAGLPRAQDHQQLPVAFAEGRPAEAAFAHALAALASHPATAPAEHLSAPVRLQIDVPVAAADWGEALGQQVVWLAARNEQAAELRLNPPHLGPVDVTLSLGDDQASIAFVSAQQAVREAIEAALPTLRAALAENGIELGNATVSAEASPRQGQGREERGWRDRGGTAEPAHALAAGVGPATSARLGMVDTFA